jgi:predicted nucleic acid-binding Zn ribbon protein
VAQHLAEILENMNTGLGRAVKLCGWLAIWDKVVDDRIRKHTEAVKISNKTLSVSTSSPTWANELTFLKGEFIKKFNQAAGQEIIRDIKFKAGG